MYESAHAWSHWDIVQKCLPYCFLALCGHEFLCLHQKHDLLCLHPSEYRCPSQLPKFALQKEKESLFLLGRRKGNCPRQVSACLKEALRIESGPLNSVFALHQPKEHKACAYWKVCCREGEDSLRQLPVAGAIRSKWSGGMNHASTSQFI